MASRGESAVAAARDAHHLFRRGGRRVGGSTITMQLARNRFGIDSRTLAEKFGKSYAGIELERFYTKDQILEAYLTSRPTAVMSKASAPRATYIFMNHRSGCR